MNNYSSLALLTDLYQLTMANGYYRTGMADRESVFTLYFRKNPFDNPYTIAAGLAHAIDYLQNFHFSAEDIAYLAQLQGNDGQLLFSSAFLTYLSRLQFSCDVDALPEGTVVFPNQPMLRIKGPLIEAQLFETALLNILNFQSLIATKATRVVRAAQGDTVLEFGLRRAQGIDGGLAASRAAYIGGCHATSNVLAGKLFGIPVRGTHAHSWVMCFDSEPEAFMQYAKVMPNNCTFLVDTYNTIEGVKNAIEVGKWLQTQGHKLAGIRLDSGDLAALSIEARKILDNAGFTDTRIVASNDLDEYSIAKLKQAGSPIAIWGVGTKLVTAFDQPALGGVYKLTAIKNKYGEWQARIKHSETLEKASTPGMLQVRRFHKNGAWVGDMLYNEFTSPFERTQNIITEKNTSFTFDAQLQSTDLLQPIFRGGNLVYKNPDIHSIRQYTLQQMQKIHATQNYPVGWEQSLHELRQNLLKGNFLFQDPNITQLLKGTNIRDKIING